MWGWKLTVIISFFEFCLLLFLFWFLEQKSSIGEGSYWWMVLVPRAGCGLHCYPWLVPSAGGTRSPRVWETSYLFISHTGHTDLCWSAVEKYRLVLCPAFPRGSFSSSVVYSLSLDYIPYPKTNVPLSSQAVPLWLSFLTHLVFFSLDGPSPDAWHLLSGLDATWSLKSLNALSAQPQDTGISCLLPALLGSLSLEG